MPQTLQLFATCPKGMAELLSAELEALGAGGLRQTRAGVSFRGSLESAYRASLWSRLASRVLLPLAVFPAGDPEALYAGVQTVDWSEHLDRDGTLAVDFITSRSAITHTHFGAQKVKDAVVDQFRSRTGTRPGVDLVNPHIRLNVYLDRDEATLYLDLAGEALHRRGYRQRQGEAPLKENLAAAILLRAGWPEVAKRGGPLVDLMCGSGTLPIEGAMMAADIAPGLGRALGRSSFQGWKQHDAALWEALVKEAKRRRLEGLKRLPPIIGYDTEAAAVREARATVERAGLSGHVYIERRALEAWVAAGAFDGQSDREKADEILPAGHPAFPGKLPGLAVANPPYGQRLGDQKELGPLYATLGSVLRGHFESWKAAVFTGNAELGHQIGLRARLTNTLYNGAIRCTLLRFEMDERTLSYVRKPAGRDRSAGPRDVGSPHYTGDEGIRADAATAGHIPPDEGVEMFANRLRKNLKTLGRWGGKNDVTCYRLYDADLPEYSLAIDFFEGQWAHVQEYEAPATVDRQKADRRRASALAVIPEVLNLPPEQVHFKIRSRQRGTEQYEKLADKGRFHEVREGICRFLVNFSDYLDTGLFLDHRPIRAMIQDLARGRRFLNLFGYTGAATVHAAAGGAVATTTVDMSRTYLDWAGRNLELNGFEIRRHELVRADCLEWLGAGQSRQYDLILLDPPTFSSSKRMTEPFDVQHDHVPLIRRAVSLLAPGGFLLFSNNFRRFKMDVRALADLHLEDISPRTIPYDFRRTPRIHTCWRIEQRTV